MKTTIEDVMKGIAEAMNESDPLVRRAMMRMPVLFYGYAMADESFIRGAQRCREMMALFVEGQGHSDVAASIRANWNPSWGPDPGPPKRDKDD